MQIASGVPAHQLDSTQPILVTFVVLGPGHSDSKAGYHAGRIKAVRFGPNIGSPLLVVEKAERGGRMTGVRGLHLTAAEMAKGSMFLRDLYEAEGRLADYERYVARERAIANGMQVDPLSEFDPRLPAAVVKWRRERGVKAKFVWGDDEPAALEEPQIEKPVRRRAAAADPPAGGAS